MKMPAGTMVTQWVLQGQFPRHLKRKCLLLLALPPTALIRAASTRVHICRKSFPLVLRPAFWLDITLVYVLNVPISQLPFKQDELSRL